MSNPLAARLKSVRLARGLSQKALGLAIGMDPTVASARMNQYERGTHQPDFNTVKRLGAVLDVPAIWFYADDDEALWVEAWHHLTPAERKVWLAALAEGRPPSLR